MATGENLSRTLEGGHEPFYEFACTLCGNEGRHVEAARYCEECFVYMCDPCVKSHNRIPLNTSHKQLDKGQFQAVSQSVIKSFPTKRCLKHPGELVNIFCGNHDVVCCSVCKALNHSTCNKTKHLPDAAKGIKTSTEYKTIRKETQVFLSDINKLLDNRKGDRSRIDKERERVKRTIADFRKKVNKYFDDLEQKSLNELDLKETLIISGLEKDRQFLDKTKKEAEEILKRLDTFRGDNECELFFQVKTCKCFIGESTERVEDISSTAPDSLVFKINGSIENYLSSIPTLGWFDDRHSATVQYSQEASGTGANSARRPDSKVAAPRHKDQTTTTTPDNNTRQSDDNTAPTNKEVNPVTKVVVGSRIRYNNKFLNGLTGRVTAVHPDGTVNVKWGYGGTEIYMTVRTGLGDVTLI